MIPKSFKQHAQIILLEGFAAKLERTKKEYAKVQKEFNKYLSELSEKDIDRIVPHLSINSTELDLINNKLEEISQIIEHLKEDFNG